MKTILFKVWKFPQLSETFIVNQIVMAIRMGYSVQILVGEHLDIPEYRNFALFKEYNLEDKIVIEDYKIPSNKFQRIVKAGQLVLENLRFLAEIKRFYTASRKKDLIPLYEFCFYKQFRETEIIHIQFGTNQHPVALLKKGGLLKSKIIVSFHGHDLHFPINNRITNNGYYTTLFKQAKWLIANTPFLAEKLIELNAPEDKIKIIPVSVDINFFQPLSMGTTSKIIKLLTVGRLDELKGQKYGIEAVKKLISSGYTLEYYIAGQGSYLKKLQSQVKRLKLEKHIFFTGALSQSQIKKLMQESDIFLMTSITNSRGMSESQGLVTAEAQACGLPVIAFDSGGIKYTLQEGKTGFLCPEKDLECYTSKIELLLKDEILRNKMGKDAVTFVDKEYSEHSVIKKWKEIYG